MHYNMLLNLYFSIIFMSINLLVQHLEADLEPALNNMTKVNNMDCSEFFNQYINYIVISTIIIKMSLSGSLAKYFSSR